MTEQNNNSCMLPVGTILHGSFRIDRYLSSGGFGNTYVATNINFNEVVAVKEFFIKGVSQRGDDSRSVSISNDDNMQTFDSQKLKFKKEAQRLHNLHNEHIVRVHDLFEENGTIYYIMDYIDGISLRQKMKGLGHPMSEGEVLDILKQLLDALNAVHKQKIYHLDLKPANIMLTRENVVVLIDFGASKLLSSDENASTSTGVSYTEGYAPSEQVERNLSKMGPWTDFYALGATLYNLLSGRKPPMPSDVIYDETPDKHVSLPLPTGISQPMHDLVLWLMQGNRSKRPQSVGEINDWIDRHFVDKSAEDALPVEDEVPEDDDTHLDRQPDSDNPKVRKEAQQGRRDQEKTATKPSHPAGSQPGQTSDNLPQQEDKKKKRLTLMAVLAILIIGTGAFLTLRPTGGGTPATSVLTDSIASCEVDSVAPIDTMPDPVPSNASPQDVTPTSSANKASEANGQEPSARPSKPSNPSSPASSAKLKKQVKPAKQKKEDASKAAKSTHAAPSSSKQKSDAIFKQMMKDKQTSSDND